MVASRENFPLLAELLTEQQRLDTPVARFATAQDAASVARPSTLTSRLGPRLIPLSKPKPGEQYAFEVDLDSCTGCKSCVAACHSLNGLDDTETWRDVGLLVSSEPRHPFTQTVTTACHHCADPACLNGCPVLAYEKDPVTGIVRHLDDQCIGCSYCILKCPYDVPKFSTRLGIVRKCDLCHGRLAHGEPPACAQACPTQAIRIVTVSTSQYRTPDTGCRTEESSVRCGIPYPQSGTSSSFLPGAPDPGYTQPTTRYVSKRGLPASIVAADAATLRPQPPHWPLVILLTLLPLAIGCSIVAALGEISTVPIVAQHVTNSTAHLARVVTHYVTMIGWAAGAAGLAFSVAHLGRPLRAWRIFLGLRRSWLSREAVVFGAWFLLASIPTAVRLGWLPSWPAVPTFNPARAALAIATASLGVLGLFCSVMIYADTRREFWRAQHTAPRFFGSAAVLGLASALAASQLASAASPDAPPVLGCVLAVTIIAKLLFEARAIEPLKGDRDTLTPALKTARLLAGPLRTTNELRVACGVFSGVLVPALLAPGGGPGWLVWTALIAVLAGEFLERSLFFRAVDAPKMPGVPS